MEHLFENLSVPGRKLEKEPEKVDAIEWFPFDYRLHSQGNFKLWEQCVLISANKLVSCLWR